MAVTPEKHMRPSRIGGSQISETVFSVDRLMSTTATDLLSTGARDGGYRTETYALGQLGRRHLHKLYSKGRLSHDQARRLQRLEEVLQARGIK